MNMPAIKNTAVAALLSGNKVAMTPAGGTNFLSFDAKRTGEWTLGADKEACTGDVFSLDVASLKHGYILWHQRKANRRLVAINQPLPEPQDPVYYEVKGKETVDEAAEARALEGSFEDGTKFVLEVSTFGGRKAVDGLIAEVMQRFAHGNPCIFPQVRLDSDSYDHATYGKVFTPELAAVAWFDESGQEEAAATPAIEDDTKGEQVRGETDSPGIRRRRRA